MSIINIFGKILKPIKLGGTGVLHPTPTSILDENISTMQQYDVNLWFYRKGEHLIAFDGGYDDFPEKDKEFRKICLDPLDVEAVFITHADMDHVGGLSDGVASLFPKAKLYLHEKEIDLWKGEIKRFKFGPFSLENPISRQQGFIPLQDGEVIQIGDIKVEIIHTPGHTPGHSCYLVDDEVLITGDVLAINEKGGYCFFDFFNMDTSTTLASLQKLKKRFELSPPRMICTGHSGYSTEKEKYFLHIEEIAKGTKKEPFDSRAPYDVFR